MRLLTLILLIIISFTKCYSQSSQPLLDSNIRKKIDSFLYEKKEMPRELPPGTVAAKKILPLLYNKDNNTGVFKVRVAASHANTYLLIVQNGRTCFIENSDPIEILPEIQKFLKKNKRIFTLSERDKFMSLLGNEVFEDWYNHNETINSKGFY